MTMAFLSTLTVLEQLYRNYLRNMAKDVRYWLSNFLDLTLVKHQRDLLNKPYNLCVAAYNGLSVLFRQLSACAYTCYYTLHP